MGGLNVHGAHGHAPLGIMVTLSVMEQPIQCVSFAIQVFMGVTPVNHVLKVNIIFMTVDPHDLAANFAPWEHQPLKKHRWISVTVYFVPLVNT